MNLDERAAKVGLKRSEGESDASLLLRVTAAESLSTRLHDSILLSTRAAIRPGSVNIEERTVVFVASTGFRDIRRPYGEDPYYEELAITSEAIRFGRFVSGAPFLNAHSSWDVGDVLGVIERAWLEGGEMLTQVRFSSRADVEPIFTDVANGILRNVSVGYRVYKWERSRKQGEEFDTFRAIDWEPWELSLVPIGFDPGAQARAKAGAETLPCEILDLTKRAKPTTTEQEKTMNLEQRAAKVGLTRLTGESDEAFEARVAAKEAEVAAAGTRTATPGATATSEAVISDAVQRGIESERTRVNTIRSETRAAGIADETFVESLISGGVTIDAARAKIIDKLSKDQTSRGQSSGIVTGTDQSKVIEVRGAVVDAILHRADRKNKIENNMSNHFAPMSLMRLAEECLLMAGINPSGMNKMQLVGRALTTSDFPNILADVMNKFLRNAYTEPTRTFVGVFRERTNSDFKNINSTMLSEAPDLELKNEDGEYKYGTIVDGKEVYKLSSYGKILRFSREAIINDDLNALSRIPQLFGAAAARLESQLVWGVFTANAALADAVALFHSTHANVATAGSINATNVGVLRKQMRKQTGPNGANLDIVPKFLICGPDKEFELDQFFGSFNPAAQDDVTPGHMRSLIPIVESRLTGSKWYLAADYNSIDTVEYCYLEGAQGVYTETRERFDTDGVEIKARHDFAAKAMEHRGLQGNGF